MTSSNQDVIHNQEVIDRMCQYDLFAIRVKLKRRERIPMEYGQTN